MAPSAPFRLPDATRLGPITLQVDNLDRSLEYYTRILGFRMTSRSGTDAALAPHGSDEPLLELHASPGAAPHPRRGRLGLFHFAVLLPSRADLARFVRHLQDAGVPAGASDHLVSEALYLTDPDGLGIEVYADRPRSSWRWADGQLAMATEPLDFESLLRDGRDGDWAGMPSGTRIGHMHLHVGDLTEAESFYSAALGLDVVVRGYPGALFLSAGGYHHHLGINTWAGPRAEPPAASDARLLEWSVVLPSRGDVEAVARNAQADGRQVVLQDSAARLTDPWGTALRVVAEAART